MVLIPFVYKVSTLPKWILLLCGLITVLYSVFTNYEMGVIPLVSIKGHLIIDGLVGFFLVLSPMIFGFVNEVYIPFLAIGVLVILISLITVKKPVF